MSTDNTVVVDYGLGNLYSVESALAKCGAKKVLITSDESKINNADRLILPGVGSFSSGIRSLKDHGLISAIKSHSAKDKPLLGICLGMQLLASKGTEYEEADGLDIVPGTVLPILENSSENREEKVPFVGWSTLIPADELEFCASILKKAGKEGFVYHLHSFYFSPENPENLLASYYFGSRKITAAVRLGNTYGLQFHPEKSGDVGLDILAEFMRI